jgi:hypothetical protein
MSRCVQTFHWYFIFAKKDMGIRSDADNYIDGSYNISAILKQIYPLKKIFQNYHHHVSCPTKVSRVLDHYTQTSMVGTNPSPSPLQTIALLLQPTYKQQLKREPPTQRIVRHLTEEADSMLQDYFFTDWNTLHCQMYVDTCLSNISFQNHGN